MPDAIAPPLAAPVGTLRHLRRALRVAIVIVTVSVMFAAVFGQRFWITFVYSISIATACWLFCDIGRMLATRWLQRSVPPAERNWWPGWGPMAAILVVGTALGYSLGNAFANFVLGTNSAGLLEGSPRRALAILGLSLVPGFGATYFFRTRARIAESEARALAAQREAAENQLRLLQSQLEPHMLFNTLANLRVLIATDPPRAQAMLDQLIAFLRATLAASRTGTHSLADEFARLADYLALMKVRLGERLRFEFDLPRELANAAVPPLLLQPLIENSIKHAIEPSVAGGRIAIGAAREGSQLVLRVRDSGAEAADAAPPGSRFGLEQVRARLAALHGAAASLTLEAAQDAGGGTVATLRMPLEADA
ncbi:MAG TPA: histidine kinase [Burkholderiaceae bacterium]|nr:histidine kinase [Burkholderiaceae bacterium]